MKYYSLYNVDNLYKARHRLINHIVAVWLKQTENIHEKLYTKRRGGGQSFTFPIPPGIAF